MRRRVKLPLAAGAMLLAVYAVAAYVAAPLVWRDIERERRTGSMPMLTRTLAGIPGDPVNVGFVGTQEQVLRAFAAVGWHPADPVTLRTSVGIGLSVLLDRPYPGAPVSTLIYDGRPQDLAFEKEDGASASRRHHVRLWRTDRGSDGRTLWLGSASFDRDAGFSRDTGQITHHIAPDVDAERDALMASMQAAGRVSAVERIDGRGATSDARNGGGDPYFTDGYALVGTLAE